MRHFSETARRCADNLWDSLRTSGHCQAPLNYRKKSWGITSSPATHQTAPLRAAGLCELPKLTRVAYGR